MSRNRFQSWLLRTRIKCDILFDPEKLADDTEFVEPKESVNARFKNLPREQKDALRAHFGRSAPLLPFRIYELTRDAEDEGRRKFRIRYDYDRPEQRLEMKRLALAGFDLTRLEKTYFTFPQLREFRRAQEKGVDIEPLLDNRFNRFQLMVLSKALADGYDVSEFCHPSWSANAMANLFVEQVEDRMLQDTYMKNANRHVELFEASQEHQTSRNELPFTDRLRDAQDRSSMSLAQNEGKVLHFPTHSQSSLQR